MLKRKKIKGFSLIELLLSLAIISILSIAAFLLYQKVDYSIKEKKLEERVELLIGYSRANRDYSSLTFKEYVLDKGENLISEQSSSFQGIAAGVRTEVKIKGSGVSDITYIS